MKIPLFVWFSKRSYPDGIFDNHGRSIFAHSKYALAAGLITSSIVLLAKYPTGCMM